MAWMIFGSTTGDLLWQQCIGGGGNEVCFDFVDQNNGELILLGSTFGGNSGDVNCNLEYGQTAAWLVSVTDTTNTGINESDKKNQRITVFPVPADQFVKFDLTNYEPGKVNLIVIMNEIGKIVYRIEIGKSDRYTVWNTLNCSSGLYSYQIKGDSSSEAGKIIIMK
jgi:hypothetical protein